nr:MAG TPA: hypothetical protein [Caudoviricetes sp.]
MCIIILYSSSVKFFLFSSITSCINVCTYIKPPFQKIGDISISILSYYVNLCNYAIA